MAGPVKTFTEGTATIGINVTSVIDVADIGGGKSVIKCLGPGDGSTVSHTVTGTVAATITTLNTP